MNDVKDQQLSVLPDMAQLHTGRAYQLPHAKKPLLMASQQKRQPKEVVLYHGSSKFFQGPPDTKGLKSGHNDVLGTSFISMTPYDEVAQFFSNGSIDGRIFSISVPENRIYDLSQESNKYIEDGKERALGRRIEGIAKTGEWDAVAIHDISTGDPDSVELRLLKNPQDFQWYVKPSDAFHKSSALQMDQLRKVRTGEINDKKVISELIKSFASAARLDEEAYQSSDADSTAEGFYAARANWYKDLAKEMRAKSKSLQAANMPRAIIPRPGTELAAMTSVKRPSRQRRGTSRADVTGNAPSVTIRLNS